MKVLPIAPASISSVKLTGGLLAERQRSVLDRSIEQQYQQCKTTGRIDALRLQTIADGSRHRYRDDGA